MKIKKEKKFFKLMKGAPKKKKRKKMVSQKKCFCVSQKSVCVCVCKCVGSCRVVKKMCIRNCFCTASDFGQLEIYMKITQKKKKKI